MSKHQFIWQYRGLGVFKKPPDPRVALGQYLKWQRSPTNDTEYSVPEPDNYNFGIRYKNIADCTFLPDQVFYFDIVSNQWWTLYYVTDQHRAKFTEWFNLQDYTVKWHHPKAQPARQRKPLLQPKKNGEMTENERLYTMGYYAKFHSKYFSEDDTMLLERMGSARAELNDLSLSYGTYDFSES